MYEIPDNTGATAFVLPFYVKNDYAHPLQEEHHGEIIRLMKEKFKEEGIDLEFDGGIMRAYSKEFVLKIFQEFFSKERAERLFLGEMDKAGIKALYFIIAEYNEKQKGISTSESIFSPENGFHISYHEIGDIQRVLEANLSLVSREDLKKFRYYLENARDRELDELKVKDMIKEGVIKSYERKGLKSWDGFLSRIGTSAVKDIFNYKINNIGTQDEN